jgi:hypothetical protein
MTDLDALHVIDLVHHIADALFDLRSVDLDVGHDATSLVSEQAKPSEASQGRQKAAGAFCF